MVKGRDFHVSLDVRRLLKSGEACANSKLGWRKRKVSEVVYASCRVLEGSGLQRQLLIWCPPTLHVQVPGLRWGCRDKTQSYSVSNSRLE